MSPATTPRSSDPPTPHSPIPDFPLSPPTAPKSRNVKHGHNFTHQQSPMRAPLHQCDRFSRFRLGSRSFGYNWGLAQWDLIHRRRQNALRLFKAHAATRRGMAVQCELTAGMQSVAKAGEELRWSCEEVDHEEDLEK